MCEKWTCFFHDDKKCDVGDLCFTICKRSLGPHYSLYGACACARQAHSERLRDSRFLLQENENDDEEEEEEEEIEMIEQPQNQSENDEEEEEEITASADYASNMIHRN